MLNCCNRRFHGSYYRVLANREDFYRRIEFGICPCCGIYKFFEYRMFNGEVKQKILSGNEAYKTFEKILNKLKEEKQGTKSNQNFYYGDYKITKKKDSRGNPIYLQLKRNFNNESTILGEVETKVIKIT